jgi:hypothetical protein
MAAGTVFLRAPRCTAVSPLPALDADEHLQSFGFLLGLFAIETRLIIDNYHHTLVETEEQT